MDPIWDMVILSKFPLQFRSLHCLGCLVSCFMTPWFSRFFRKSFKPKKSCPHSKPNLRRPTWLVGVRFEMVPQKRYLGDSLRASSKELHVVHVDWCHDFRNLYNMDVTKIDICLTLAQFEL